MADSSFLASILSGQDPLSAQMLPGYQGAQLSAAALDPNFGHNEGPLGALAKTIAGIRGGGMTSDAVNAVTQARIAAQPEIAKLLASPDSYSALANSPDQYSPLARAMVLNGANPGSVAEARLKAAQAANAAAQTTGIQALARPRPPMYGAPQPPASPAVGDVSTLGSGRYAQPAADNAAAAPDPITAAGAMSPSQRQALVQNPQQRAAIIARLRAMMPRPQAQPGAPGAAQP